MTLHVLGSIPVWIILVMLAIRWWFIRTQSASVFWLLICCLFVALGLTVNDAAISTELANLLHVPNIADVIGRCLLVCGLFSLAQSVEAAARKAQLLRPGRFILCGLVLIALIVLFTQIDAPVTTDVFMQTYGGQVPTSLYSTIEMAYVAFAVGAAAIAIVREFSEGRNPGRTYWIFAVGAVGMVLLAIVAITMNTAHVLGDEILLSWLAKLYTPLFLLSMTLLAVGSAAGALFAAAHEVTTWWETRKRLMVLEPKLRQLEQDAGRKGLYFTQHYPRSKWRMRLHRLVLEIEDRAREAGRPIPPEAQIDALKLQMESAR